MVGMILRCKKIGTILLIECICAAVVGCSHRAVLDPDYSSTHGPILVSTPKPVYPPDAEHKGVEGTVVIKLWVDSTGTPTMALIQKSPDPLLDSSATNAALASRFKPAMLDGKKVGVWFTLPFEVKKK